MKEFLIYTLMRILLLLGSFAIVTGIWAFFNDGKVHVFYAVILAFLISGVLSYFVLNRYREAFARRVQARAERASAAFEERKSREDAD